MDPWCGRPNSCVAAVMRDLTQLTGLPCAIGPWSQRHQLFSEFVTVPIICPDCLFTLVDRRGCCKVISSGVGQHVFTDFDDQKRISISVSGI